jgi:hypothetical protein
MGQSRRGVIQVLEVQVHPLVAAIPRFIQLGVPSSTTLKAFKETDMMATARSLVSLLSAFVMFFIFKNND